MRSKSAAVTLTIRIPADLKKRVERAAVADDRTVTSYIVHALRAALAAE
jgi:predicted transcriptional regulator